MGWALADAKGPENIELPAKRLAQIQQAFAAAGMPRYSAVNDLHVIAREGSSTMPRRKRRQPDNEAEHEEVEEVYEEFEAALP